ncbi:MAG: FG-GAP repeat domain-containing protein [Planctomycetota bacterium]|jgi:hypothetical protein
MNTAPKNLKNYLIASLLLMVLASAAASAAPLEFEMHRIGTFRSEACAVADLNNDGKLDIVAGSFWYEAPDYKPCKFRDLAAKLDPKDKTHTVAENGKGYYDDFTNLPLDVDGDGLKDIVTCSWFSKRYDWYKNLGPAKKSWPMTIADRGINFEAGELCDIDGDGKELEILPHCKDTRWYEAVDGKLVTHMVSNRQLNFGGGVGDVDGDGRPDIVRPDAWYRAPEDPRKGKWTEYPLALGSLEEGKSEHTPRIWIYDIDADGLNDLLTSSAHRYGIFWYRQIKKDSKISFQRRLIDKSWSQAHSLTLADLDNDGDRDLVAGKRFYAHNGSDPGAEEPLCIYWYELARKPTVRWTRHVISYDKGIGSGLEIPVADMDADGDLDIVVTGKFAGPILFENKLK